MIDLRQDLRFAYRCLWRMPGLTAAAVLVLGIGIGAVTLMFSTLHAVVLNPLPYPDPDRLVWAWLSSETRPQNPTSKADYFDYREKADAFESLAAFFVFKPPVLVTGGEKSDQVTSNYVSANFFSTLGVAPQMGRAFLPGEEEPGAGEVVVLSHGFWQRRFGGEPFAPGKTINLDGDAYEIAGVMPAGFDFPADVDVWFPLEIGYAPGRDNNNFYIVGRLADGVALEQAQAQVDVIARNIAAEFPQDRQGYGLTLVSLHERFFGPARSILLMLTALIALVPLVACANIASLFLARAAERQGELAIRFALGASRWRVVRQLLVENLLVALLGGAAGLAVTWWGALALRSLAPDALPRLAAVGIDGTVLAFALGVSLATVPLFGILPALRGSKIRLTESLKAGGDRGNSDRRAGFRNALVVAQVALSLMLMIASGLFFRSYQRLTSVDPGFRVESLLTFQLQLPWFEFDTPEALDQAWSGIHDRLRALPGTTGLGAVDRLPIRNGRGPTNFVHAADQPPASQEDERLATRRFATEGFFQALGVPLLSGRTFEATDRPGSPPVVVINETLASQFFPGDASLAPLQGSPVGRTLVLPNWDPPVHLEVVGVVADVAEQGPGAEAPPIFYMAAGQRPPDAMRFLIRTESDPLALTATLSRAVKEVHADIAVSQIATMETRLADSLVQPRFRTALVGLFALVSLIMAAIGLYGVLACIVRQRARELGIRLALGAQARDVFALIVGRGMALVGIGIGLGLAGAFAGTRIIGTLLFDVGPTDAPTFGAVSICLGLVALVACLEPAWRAMNIDPCEALKAE